MKQLDLSSYAEPHHPVQQEILHTLAGLAGIEVTDIQLGTDGCGFPVFSLPLSALASAYLKLACPDLIADAPTRAAVETITAAMNQHPLMVGGTNRVDSVLLEDDNIVAKGGFKGVFGFALKKRDLASRLKCWTAPRKNGLLLHNRFWSRSDMLTKQPLQGWPKHFLLVSVMMQARLSDIWTVNLC